MFQSRFSYKILLLIFLIDAISDLILFPIMRLTEMYQVMMAELTVDPQLHFIVTIAGGVFSAVAWWGLYKRTDWVKRFLLWGLPVFPLLSLVLTQSLALAPFTILLYAFVISVFMQQRMQEKLEEADANQQEQKSSSSAQHDYFSKSSTGEQKHDSESENDPDEVKPFDFLSGTFSPSDKADSPLSQLQGGKKILVIVSFVLSGYSLLNAVTSFSSLTGFSLEILLGTLFSLLFAGAFAYFGNRMLGFAWWRYYVGLILLATASLGLIFSLSLYSIAGTPEAAQMNELLGSNIISERYGLVMGMFNLFLIAVGWPLYKNGKEEQE